MQWFQSRWWIVNHLPLLILFRSSNSKHCETSENADIASIPSFGATRVSIAPKKSSQKGLMFGNHLLHATNVISVDRVDFCHHFEMETHFSCSIQIQDLSMFQPTTPRILIDSLWSSAPTSHFEIHPRQPAGAACGEHVPGPCRAPALAHSDGWPSRVRG